MADPWKTLTRGDIPGFDKTMTELVLDMSDAGWLGRVSSKGHAIMRAPDGEATHSVSRNSLQARAGRNSRATFERWKKDRQIIEQEQSIEPKPHVCKQCGESFGTSRGLGAHRKKHFEPIPCPVCDRPVKYMARHMATHDEIKPVEKTLSERLFEMAVEVEALEKKILKGERNGS